MTTTTKNTKAKIEEFINRSLSGKIAAGREAIDNFANKLLTGNDPLYTMDWSEKAFEEAASYKVWATISVRIEKMGIEEGLKASLAINKEEAIRGAMYPSRSTSAISNFSKQCEVAAIAKSIEWLDNRLVDLAEAE